MAEYKAVLVKISPPFLDELAALFGILSLLARPDLYHSTRHVLGAKYSRGMIKKKEKVETHGPLEKRRVSRQGRSGRSLRREAVLA